jgi:uncharacterized protein DUF6885
MAGGQAVVAGARPASGVERQQRDYLCGPFHAARVLRDAGVAEWDGEAVDQDLIASRAGTILPAAEEGPAVPPGARSLRGYRHDLARGEAAGSGTAADALAEAIEAAGSGSLRCLGLRGAWTAERVERLVDAAPSHGARLLANLRTGPLWAGRPPLAALLAALDGDPVADPPAADWDVGHFVELAWLVRGPGGALVLVVDSYPELGWDGHHLQPPAALAAALERGDGHEGGVLAVMPAARAAAARDLARELGLEIGFWENGTRRD